MISSQTPDLAYRRLASKGRHINKQNEWPTRRLAILSEAASQQFVQLLKALFAENEVNLEVYEGAFNSIELEAYNVYSTLYQFAPDTIVLGFATQALRTSYFQHPDAGFVERSEERIEKIWNTLRAHTTAQILQFNYAIPYERFLGSYDLHLPESLYAITARLNAFMASAALLHPNVTVCDVDAISSNVGRHNWFDDRLWNLTKAFCNLDYLPLVCQSLVEIVLAQMGRVRKCIVLDLDNTLWGGIVGDQGHLGIDIGAHGDGEPFWHFQHYLLALKRRGIILAVCSKNDLANALQPFAENPDMVLKRTDIAVFVANWENKADNILKIREGLNIGLDAIVFLDDNAFERNLVRRMLPEVTVPELPEDPADYVRFVSALNLFETRSYSANDAIRSDQYIREAERQDLRARVANVDDYLNSLDMQIRVARFDPENLGRIAQLMQRSNQFNLTTNRRNDSECDQLMRDKENCLPLYASLKDRFGDHGLITVVSMRISEEGLVISDWLMSCRVLARGVEQFLMNYVVHTALQRKIPKICGEYIPTAKNSMVKDFFARFGFEKASEVNGRTHWVLDPEVYQPSNTYIREL